MLYVRFKIDDFVSFIYGGENITGTIGKLIVDADGLYVNVERSINSFHKINLSNELGELIIQQLRMEIEKINEINETTIDIKKQLLDTIERATRNSIFYTRDICL